MTRSRLDPDPRSSDRCPSRHPVPCRPNPSSARRLPRPSLARPPTRALARPFDPPAAFSPPSPALLAKRNACRAPFLFVARASPQRATLPGRDECEGRRVRGGLSCKRNKVMKRVAGVARGGVSGSVETADGIGERVASREWGSARREKGRGSFGGSFVRVQGWAGRGRAGGAGEGYRRAWREEKEEKGTERGGGQSSQRPTDRPSRAERQGYARAPPSSAAAPDWSHPHTCAIHFAIGVLRLADLRTNGCWRRSRG